MNYINCKKTLPPETIRKSIVFWCENSIQHISSFLRSVKGSGAILNDEFLIRKILFKKDLYVALCDFTYLQTDL